MSVVPEDAVTPLELAVVAEAEEEAAAADDFFPFRLILIPPLGAAFSS